MKDHVLKTDVVLGRGGLEKGIYADILTAWWERYEVAAHSQKRDIGRLVIDEMLGKNIRFLSKVEDGSRLGYFDVEPKDSMKIMRKVIRALRAEVLRHTSNLCSLAKVKREAALEKARNSVTFQARGPTYVKKKIKAARLSTATEQSRASSNSPTIIVETLQDHETPHLVMANPSPLSATKARIVVPPAPPPPPPVMRMHSFASLEGFQDSELPLIPSAVNWGTSDIVGDIVGIGTEMEHYSKQQAAVSPDTVLPPQLPIFQSTASLAGLKQPPKLQMRSSVPFDFARVFEDEFLGPTKDNVNNCEPLSPLFTGCQSSTLGAANLNDWYDAHFASDDAATLKPSKSNRRFSLIDDDDEPMPANIIPYPLFLSEPTFSLRPIPRSDYIDRGIFDELTTPATAFTSPSSPTQHATDVTPMSKPEADSVRFSGLPSCDILTPNSPFETPNRSATKRQISDIFEEGEEEYQSLRLKLEVSMVKLEEEEKELKQWEVHNEALWSRLVDAQPNLAAMGRQKARRTAPAPKRRRASTQRAAAKRAQRAFSLQLTGDSDVDGADI